MVGNNNTNPDGTGLDSSALGPSLNFTGHLAIVAVVAGVAGVDAGLGITIS